MLADDALARGDAIGPLHGLPIAHKDLQITKGIRTTFGSPILQRLRARRGLAARRADPAGGRDPASARPTRRNSAPDRRRSTRCSARPESVRPTKTCGGSSGGAAVALACGMLPIADGTDMGGSLRNPASFCDVVGLRPSPGRVPVWPARLPWSPLSVDGPMARNVADVALLLSAMAGPDPRSPIALGEAGTRFAGRSTATSTASASPGGGTSAACRSIAVVRRGRERAARGVRVARLHRGRRGARFQRRRRRRSRRCARWRSRPAVAIVLAHAPRAGEGHDPVGDRARRAG